MANHGIALGERVDADVDALRNEFIGDGQVLTGEVTNWKYLSRLCAKVWESAFSFA